MTAVMTQVPVPTAITRTATLQQVQQDICAFFIHNEEKDMKIFGGYEIITYICSIKQIKQLDYARDTKNVWNEILFLFT